MSLHYGEYGDPKGDLIMFLHGGGVSGWMWDKQVQYFTNFHCVVPDLPQQGLSKQHHPFTIHNSAEQLITLIEEKAKGKKVIVIGFSLGAQIIVQMLGMKSNLIDIAIINSALVRPSPTLKKWIRPSIKLTFPLARNRVFSKLQAKMLYISEHYFDQYYAEICDMKLDTLVQILEENMTFALPAGFKNASGKILITVGQKEKAIMKASAKDIVQSNLNCTGVIIPAIGHGVSLAQPELFNKLVEEWIVDGKVSIGEAFYSSISHKS